MKAFISHQFGDNIESLINLLRNNNIEILDGQTDLIYGGSFQKTIKNAIKECDFIVIIYSSSNPNIAFEAGVAVSLNKPIFSIVSEKKDYPDFLFDSVYVNAQPEEVDKIEFNLNIFLNKIKKKYKPTSSASIKTINKNEFYGGGYPNYYNQINNWYKNLSGSLEKDYEILFGKIFELYKLNVVQNKFDSNLNFITDFCVWSDELKNVIGNPILIEIKKEISLDNLESIKSLLSKLLETNPAESCLIFYESLRNIDAKELPNTPHYLFIKISDFIEKFKTSDFNQSIIEIRNEIVHNKY